MVDLINQEFLSKNVISTLQVNDQLQDYVLRCTSGIYEGKFFYINQTRDGETIGGSNLNKNLSLYIENAGLSPVHTKIMYDEVNKKYNITNLSIEKGVWVKVRSENPVQINDELEIIYDKEKFILQKSKQFDNELQYWLQRINLQKLQEILNSQNINTIQDMMKLDANSIKQYDLNEIEKNNLITAIQDIPDDFSEQYLNYGLALKSKSDNQILQEINWCGSNISDTIKSYIKQNENQENDEKESGKQSQNESKQFILYVKYQYGLYWLTTSQIEQTIYYNLKYKIPYQLSPDDIFKIGDLELLVQRFNCGEFQDIGTRKSMEDAIVIRQEINISYRLDCSVFAVFDGHGGSDCVKFISQQLIINLRNQFIKQIQFDDQEDFYKTIYDIINQVVVQTDLQFYDLFQEYAFDSGCTATIILIIGDIIFCINIGDSRAVLSRNKKAIPLSIDHKPSDPNEQKRIEKAGGAVQFNRIFGNLGVSRAFGDFDYKPISRREVKSQYTNDLVSVQPDITMHKLDYVNDEFIVVGCDGLFDILQNQELVNMIYDKLISMPPLEQDPQLVAQSIVKYAVQQAKLTKKHSDNISIIIINFSRGIFFKESSL